MKRSFEWIWMAKEGREKKNIFSGNLNHYMLYGMNDGSVLSNRFSFTNFSPFSLTHSTLSSS